MLVSRSHGFYFIRPKKVAGTTTECVLAQLCQGENDIYTKFKVSEERDKPNRKGEYTKDYSPDFVDHTNYADLSSRVDLSGLTPIITIRHPYAVCASGSAWMGRGQKQYTTDGFVSKKSDIYVRYWFEKRFGPDRDDVNGEIGDNKYEMYRHYEFYGDALKHPDLITIRYSHLIEDLSNLCDMYDIPVDIPHCKKTSEFTPERAKEIFHDHQLEYIQESWKKTFDHWGWET